MAPAFCLPEPGTPLAPLYVVIDQPNWDDERSALLGRRISELGLTIRGTRVERLVSQLYAELAAKSIEFRPVVYLSDQWGCPDGTPVIGVPFYLVDERLRRIESEMSTSVEDDAEAMAYMRHECGHAINYAFALHERREWREIFGPFSKPYRDRYRTDPFSREFVRHILGWYAQKHPDEDFAETFAVWMTPRADWRREYAGWPALAKLEYVDAVLREIGPLSPSAPDLTADDLPVEAMHYTIAEHYESTADKVPIQDERQFDGDLRRIFVVASEAPDGEDGANFTRQHHREIVGRISYWTGEAPSVVRSFVDHVAARAAVLNLRVRGLDASTLIELTAFGTAVVMNHRYTHTFRRPPKAARVKTVPE